VALIGTTEVHDPQEGRLLLAGLEGGTPRELVANYAGHFAAMEWMDDRTLLALGQVGVASELLKVPLDGESEPVGERGPVIGALSLAARNGRLALIVEARVISRRLRTVVVGSAPAPWRLTDSNPWLAQIEIAPQEVVRCVPGGSSLPADPGGARWSEAHEANGWKTTYSRLGQLAARAIRCSTRITAEHWTRRRVLEAGPG
jgi:hypothetical protein